MSFAAFPRLGSTDPAIQALGRFGYDRQTGVVGTTLTLANAPVDGTLLLFKNGGLMDSTGGYTVSARVVTLGVAAISGDVFQAYYHYRQAI